MNQQYHTYRPEKLISERAGWSGNRTPDLLHKRPVASPLDHQTELAPLNETIQRRPISFWTRSSPRSSSDSRWCLGWHSMISLMKMVSWSLKRYLDAANLRRQGKCLRTAFINAIDRGHTTGATLRAEQARLMMRNCKLKFYRCSNTIYSKSKGNNSEIVCLEFLKRYCTPIVLYEMKRCPD